MMDIVLVMTFVSVLLISFLIFSKRSNLPPGPRFTLPILGNYFFVKHWRKKRIHHSLLDAAESYGNIFSFRIGQKLIVVLNGWDAIHQAFVKQSRAFSDRPYFNSFRNVNPPITDGIALRPYSHGWKTLRRFTLQTLRDFGVGKTSIEEKIAVEVNAAGSVIDAAEGNPIEIRTIMQKLVGNVLYGIVFGKRFDFNDPNFEVVRRLSDTVVSGEGIMTATNFLPLWISRLLFRRLYEEAENRAKNLDDIKYFINEQIRQHEESFDRNNIRDFLDLYIDASENAQKDKDDVINQDSLFRVVTELFVAGTETTYNTLDWAFLLMSEYPEIQEKCFKEIKETVGYKYIDYADRAKLIYVDATISEIQRVSNIASAGMPHAASEDTTLNGYHIPKGTILMPNIYSALNDPKYWDEPEKIKPERFIDETGKLIKYESLIPFGTGPRICLGEPLARMELFLVFANLVQKYRFERENDTFRHTMGVRPEMSVETPLPYKLRIKRR